MDRRTDAQSSRISGMGLGIAVGIAVGSGFGVAVGAALHNIAAGLALGLGFGVAIGIGIGAALGACPRIRICRAQGACGPRSKREEEADAAQSKHCGDIVDDGQRR